MTLCLSGEKAFSDSGVQEVYEVPRSRLLHGIWPPTSGFTTNPLRLAHKEALLNDLARTLQALNSAEVVTALDRVGVPVVRVADIGEVLDDPATHARAMVLGFERDDCGPARVVNSPFKFDGEAPSVRRPPPRMGEHNEERLQRSKKGRSDAASV
jgi:succinate--hydroxymethylglutarate CoA-transferase